MAQSLPPERASFVRRTGVVFVAYLALITAGIAAAIALGLIRAADDEAAGRTVERFATALELRDGQTACSELSADTRGELESQEAAECEEAILELDLALGSVTDVTVAETTASVELTEGGSVYLEETSEGWRITAVGCQPRPSEPDDCDVEA
jgi:hypothetical protein